MKELTTAGDIHSMSAEHADPTFDEVVLPHLAAAYRLARWLMRDHHEAEDIVQEAVVRALRYFRTFTGGDGRAWFLRIVRNTGYLRLSRSEPAAIGIDAIREEPAEPSADPEARLLQALAAGCMERALGDLSPRWRELLRRREVEGLSYGELARAMNVPIGTVMSGLSRARRALRQALTVRSTAGTCME